MDADDPRDEERRGHFRALIDSVRRQARSRADAPSRSVRVVPLQDSLTWEPNVPEAQLSFDAGLAVLALNPHFTDPDDRAVVILWHYAASASIAPPNDEGRADHPLYESGLATLLWLGEVIEEPRSSETRLRHFILALKEDVVEVVAPTFVTVRLSGTPAEALVSALAPIHCPRCGEVMFLRDGTPTCSSGTMGLSPKAHADLLGIAANPPRTPEPLRRAWGGHWHCPRDGAAMRETDGMIGCPDCGRFIPSRVLYHIMKSHIHQSNPGDHAH